MDIRYDKQLVAPAACDGLRTQGAVLPSSPYGTVAGRVRLELCARRRAEQRGGGHVPVVLSCRRGRDTDGRADALRLGGDERGDGGNPVGRYQVLYYNNDYEVVQFRGVGDFWQQECYTREGSLFEPVFGNASYSAPRAKGTEEERVVITPEMMWGDHAMNVDIRERGLSYWFVRDGETERTTIERDELRLTLMPHEQICRYTYEIRNVKNVGYVTQMSASLSGMSGSVFCAAEQVEDEAVTLPFEASFDEQTHIVGGFHTFGHHPENDERHKLALYVWLNDGSKWLYTFDVTGQVDEAPDKRRVHIVIDELSLPEPIGDDSGFQPTVDGWIEEEEEIWM